MPVYSNSISFVNPLDSTSVDWLLANVGDPLVIEHEIEVNTYAINSTENPWVMNNTDGYLPYAGSDWITGGDFSAFNTGDTIQLYNYVASTGPTTYTIVEKLSNTEIRVSPPLPNPPNSPHYMLALGCLPASCNGSVTVEAATLNLI